MIRRGVAIWMGVVAVLCLGGVELAVADVPEGPRLAFVQWALTADSFSLRTSDPAGNESQILLRGSRRKYPIPAPLEDPAWSPDGRVVAFTGALDDGGSEIFVVSAEGGAPVAIPGTEGGRAPVFSPDGESIAFARTREREREVRRPRRFRQFNERNVSTWMVGLDGGSPLRLTTRRFGVEHLPTSFSPDGGFLAVTRSLDLGLPAVVGLNIVGGPSRLLVRNASLGRFSPDGTQMAYLGHGPRYTERDDDGSRTTGRTTDLFVKRLDDPRSVRLTHTPRLAELWPSWDPSGSRLAFVQLGTASSFFETFGVGDSIVQINSDGTCGEKLLSLRKAALYGAAWQPGPAREAGRIVC